jgi:hypothetical protein
MYRDVSIHEVALPVIPSPQPLYHSGPVIPFPYRAVTLFPIASRHPLCRSERSEESAPVRSLNRGRFLVASLLGMTGGTATSRNDGDAGPSE